MSCSSKALVVKPVVFVGRVLESSEGRGGGEFVLGIFILKKEVGAGGGRTDLSKYHQHKGEVTGSPHSQRPPPSCFLKSVCHSISKQDA